MNKEYKDIDSFIGDLHEKTSVKRTVLDLGIFTPDDFRGDFVKCIFHDGDNTPSLQITKNFWKCYACSAKGDVIAFVQNYYNTDFMSSIKKLAEFHNSDIGDISYKFDGKTSELRKEWDMFIENMSKAPKEIQNLQKDYFPQEIGYDKKINYIVLPYTSKTGAILGFTKRRIDDSKGIKWMHSSSSDTLISSCKNIFNLYVASPEIRKKKELILSEGPKDVIAYQRIGKNNCVASSGTSNSSNIWDILLPVQKIVLSPDADKAGIDSTISNIIFLTEIFNIINVEVVVLPDGEDPYSVKNLEKFYKERIPAIDFVIENASVDDVKMFLDKTPEYNKMNIMKSICVIKSFSVREAESWINSSDIKEEKSEKISEKDHLLSIVKCLDVDVPLVDIDKAKRVLKLKYGIVIDD